MDFPTPKTSEEMLVLGERLRAGESVENEVIEGMCRWTIKMAIRYESKNKDHMIADALYLLTELVHGFRERAKDNNVEAYLKFCLPRRLISLQQARIKRQAEEYVEQLPTKRMDKLATRPNKIPLDLRDFILHVCEEGIEINIFRLSYMEYTIEEIAAELGVSKTTIGRVRQRIFDKFVEEHNKLEEFDHARVKHENGRTEISRLFGGVRHALGRGPEDNAKSSVPTNGRHWKGSDAPLPLFDRSDTQGKE